jgi:hypothetical protein
MLWGEFVKAFFPLSKEALFVKNYYEFSRLYPPDSFQLVKTAPFGSVFFLPPRWHS